MPIKNIKDLEPSERPRERLIAKGAYTLTDEELLMIILGRGVKGNSVAQIAQDLSEILDEDYRKVQLKQIVEIKGIGQAKATSIFAALEYVGRRVKPGGLKVKSSTDVMPLLSHHGYKKQEMFFCITLNGANEVVNVRTITVGLVNRTQVHPREVFADAIADRACAIIIAHNHPSGNLNPSKQDIEVTRRIREAGELLGIHLLDHIIFSRLEHYSLASHDEL